MSMVGGPIEQQFPNMLKTPLEEILDKDSVYMDIVSFTVEDYMKQSRTFPTVVIAGLFGFGPMYRYEAPANTEEETTDFSELDEL